MMKTFKSILLMVAMTAFFMPLQAAELNSSEGWYGTLLGGYAFSQNAKDKWTAAGVSQDWELKEKQAIAGGIAGGYRFSEMLRAELQVSYTAADIDEIKEKTTGTVNKAVSGHLNNWNFLVNGYYDFNTGWMVDPFVGVGLGIANVDYKFTVTAPAAYSVEKTKSTFAYQAIVGARYPVTDALDLSLEYRFVSHSKTSIERTATDKHEVSYDRHNIFLGLSMAF